MMAGFLLPLENTLSVEGWQEHIWLSCRPEVVGGICAAGSSSLTSERGLCTFGSCTAAC